MAKRSTPDELQALLPYCKTDHQRLIITTTAEHNGSGTKAAKALGLGKSSVNEVIARVKAYAASKGWAPEHDMIFTVPDTFNIKRVSTLRNGDGEVSAQWTIAEPEAVSIYDQVQAAMQVFKGELPVFTEIPAPFIESDETLLNTFISNDLHLGALVSASETGSSTDLDHGITQAKKAIDYLVASAPPAKSALIVDLGDITEMAGYKPLTNKGGHILDVSARYPDVLRAAYELFAYFINISLLKHQTVYFYNVGGNHDETSALAIREIMRVMFQNNPRVIIDDLPTDIKYHQHGKTLLQFFHGDKMKMRDAGEVMAFDCAPIFSSTEHRYGLCGHIHKDSVVDGRLARIESFRTLTVMNNWATGMGFRSGAGTMKSITYSSEHGEISRNTFSVTM
jgi:hypothetical protein